MVDLLTEPAGIQLRGLHDPILSTLERSTRFRFVSFRLGFDGFLLVFPCFCTALQEKGPRSQLRKCPPPEVPGVYGLALIHFENALTYAPDKEP